MYLTPIRVRGKRRRPGEPSAIHLPKRPKTKTQKKHRKPRAMRASYFEREVPLEVLERIFWFSENVNLPRCSPRFGRLLSGPSTLRETFIAAFGPTWDVWYGCVQDTKRNARTVHSYTGWDHDSDRFGGNPVFQSALLEYPWANISFILDCFDLWVRRHARDRPFEHIKIWGNSESADDGATAESSDGTSKVREAKYYFLHDYHAFRQVEEHETSATAAAYLQELAPASWIEVHRDTRIPDDLLTGPWNDEALQKLFWLVRAGARLSPEQTWEITQEGFQNAVSDTKPPTGNLNLTVIRLLDILGAFKTWPIHIGVEEYEKLARIHSSRASRSSWGFYYKYAYIMARLHDFVV
ncbi:Uu.00g116240.m01.CDS01 [Anthostomella pinea]|uniref:Uu.00g116240.m01.CDS01 n=1 Tax=Anthostomella pinea TaxID=933095 RepID=A0AAI8YGQ6_9PEZI|nr:Uu.00g116240.m01.CDS01 [Anthostomella pinea]